MIALKNAVIHTGEGTLAGHHVLVSGGVIHDVVPGGEVPADAEAIDLSGLHLAPGFIDLQVNGCGGAMFCEDISAETIRTMAQTSLASGTTSIAPTLPSSPDRDMIRAMEAMAEFKRTDPESGVLGLHMEGPYISPAYPGIHDPKSIRPPAPDMLARMAEAGPEIVRLATMAPEVAGPAHVRLLRDAGIRVFAGHSAATFDQAMRGFDMGYCGATHLFNAMPPIQGREPGPVGAVCAHPRARAGIIADGAHVSWANVAMAKRLLGSRLFLVTDAVAPMGADMDTFTFGGRTMHVRDGRCLDERGVLGGSVLGLDRAVANMVEHAGLDLDEALRMASLYPAACLGLDKELGRVAPGYKADLVAFSDGVRVRNVFHHGRRAIAHQPAYRPIA